MDRKEEFSSRNLNNLDRWTTSEESIENLEADLQDEDESGSGGR